MIGFINWMCISRRKEDYSSWPWWDWRWSRDVHNARSFQLPGMHASHIFNVLSFQTWCKVNVIVIRDSLCKDSDWWFSLESTTSDFGWIGYLNVKTWGSGAGEFALLFQYPMLARVRLGVEQLFLFENSHIPSCEWLKQFKKDDVEICQAEMCPVRPEDTVERCLTDYVWNFAEESGVGIESQSWSKENSSSCNIRNGIDFEGDGDSHHFCGWLRLHILQLTQRSFTVLPARRIG